MDMVIDGVRWVLWILVKGSMFLIDSVYNIIRPILTFDIGSSSIVWQWWGVLIIFLTMFTMLRIVAMMLKATVDEEYAMKLSGLQVFYRCFAIAFVVAVSPVIIKEFTAFTSVVMDSVADSFVVENNFANVKPRTDDPEKQKAIDKLYEEYDGMPSQIFISSASNGQYPPYQLIDINATEGGMDHWFDGVPIVGGFFNVTSALIGADGDYIYFPDTTMLIFLIVEGVCGAYMFLLMAIQISQRMISIAVKILISPYPISGIINPDDRSFGLWVKLISADLISNVLQYIILLLVMAITSSKMVQGFGIVGQGIFFLGGMLAVLVGPGQVAQLIGGDGMGLFMTMQGFQAMSALKGVTQAIGQKGIGMATGAAALGTYGAGRMMGLQSLGNFPAQGLPGSGGRPASGYYDPSSDPTNGTGPGGTGSGGAGNIPPRAFSEPHTEKQTRAARKYGIDISDMSKGDASLALEKAGMDKSYWRAPEQAGGASGTIDKSNPTYGFGNTPTSVSADGGRDSAEDAGTDMGSSGGGIDIGAPAGGDDGSPAGSSQAEGGIRLSREGTTARRVGDSSSFGARAVSKVGRNAYLAAGNRLMGQTNIVRGGRYITKNTKVQNLSNMHAGIDDLLHPRRDDALSSNGAQRRDAADLKEMEDFDRS
ncbi:hypothetical protein MKC73_01140 [[Clostridium] innocuum]|nr:hypothetical protein [[Clostridium] innocuum]